MSREGIPTISSMFFGFFVLSCFSDSLSVLSTVFKIDAALIYESLESFE